MAALLHTSEFWTSQNPVLGIDVEGVESDTLKQKFGNGFDRWNDLEYTGFLRVRRHLVIQDASCNCEKIIDSIIFENEGKIKDRIIYQNSGILKSKI